jgi:hypothetical protein
MSDKTLVETIDALYEKATHGTWSACGVGECSCKTISASDYPIATFTSGEWGDTFPSVRLTGDSSLARMAEAYIEKIVYGEVPEAVAEANVLLVVTLVNAWLEIRADLVQVENLQGARDKRQTRAIEWVTAAFGPPTLAQRGVRLAEEAIEAAQATGVQAAMLHRLVDYIYARPVGELAQEIGGVGLSILALAATTGVSADREEQRELDRVLAKPLAHFTARNANKNAAGFDTALTAPASTPPQDDPRDAALKQSSFCLRTLLPDHPDAQTTVRMIELAFAPPAQSPGPAAAADSDDREPFWAKCGECSHLWVCAYLPMSLTVMKAVCRALRCPNCGAGAKRIGIAKQTNGVLNEPLATVDPK